MAIQTSAVQNRPSSPLRAVPRTAQRSQATLPASESNALLAALPPGQITRWGRDLEYVAMPRGHVLCEVGMHASHAYFPVTSVVSLAHVFEDGYAPEIATVGNDGLVGLPLCMGSESTQLRATVLAAGHGYRMASRALQDAFESSAEVMHLLLRYTQALLTQMGRLGACNRHHTVVQQLCRWMLFNLDRLAGAELDLTQELIAHTLGLRREAVSDAALKLQDAGLIRYKRGHIHVLDRDGLERRACECYAVVRNEYARLLSPVRGESIGTRSPPIALRA